MQPFPTAGERLHTNLNLELSALRTQVSGVSGCAYSYVMTTVNVGSGAEGELALCGVQRVHQPRCNRQRSAGRNQGGNHVEFEQWGTAPNFQGDLITLCTCKHQMRAGMEADGWRDTWVAGFTSRSIHEGRNWLFYLARVEQGLESQYDLWNHLEADVRDAKSASHSPLGDAYVPLVGCGTDPYTPTNYEQPVTGHNHQHIWQADINNSYYGRRPALLVFDRKYSFLWQRPMIYFDGHHPRTRTSGNLPQLFDELRG